MLSAAVSGYAHDNTFHGMNTNAGNAPVQYNPWRKQPNNGWSRAVQQGSSGQHVQVLTPAQAVTVHPLYMRKIEYRDYLGRYGVGGYGNGYGYSPYYGGGLPWWSDPVAVPYGPWATGQGWPNGIW